MLPHSMSSAATTHVYCRSVVTEVHRLVLPSSGAVYEGVTHPLGPKHCVTARKKLHCCLYPSSVAVNKWTSTAHRSLAAWECIGGVALLTAPNQCGNAPTELQYQMLHNHVVVCSRRSTTNCSPRARGGGATRGHYSRRPACGLKVAPLDRHDVPRPSDSGAPPFRALLQTPPQKRDLPLLEGPESAGHTVWCAPYGLRDRLAKHISSVRTTGGHRSWV